MMTMDLDTAAAPTAPASASTGPTIKSLSATYAAIFTRPELYTRPQYHTLRAETPAPLSRTSSGLSDTPSPTSASPIVSSPWATARSGGGGDGAIDNVAAFFSRSTLAEVEEGLWDMDEEQIDHGPVSFEFDKSPKRPVVPPTFERGLSDSSSVGNRVVKKVSIARGIETVENNQITKYFNKSQCALTPKPANVVANRKGPNLLELPITKSGRQQKRKSQDLCSTPAVPPREDKVIRSKNRTSAAISSAAKLSASTSTTSIATRPARQSLARTVTVGTYLSWSRQPTPATNAASRRIPRPALPVHVATTDRPGPPGFGGTHCHDSLPETEYSHMSSDKEDDEDSAHLVSTHASRPRYTRSSTVPIITVCSPPRKSTMSCQDDFYLRHKLRTPSPARDAKHAASAAADRPSRNVAGPIAVPSRKSRLMRPMPMALITSNDVAASPDSLNLIAALRCGYTAAAFKGPDRNVSFQA
ncbi:hypothetical protein HDU87_004242 [Geranomyces variabilis]|uniref:Uncharacterized protein n=1 Tax=Geranomyces variabilis TaxID=109894 RepID=A0AAD5XQS7_9FUNG|nr:hypothetical protein HDU87_004242 [Geranomyces variabilis]